MKRLLRPISVLMSLIMLFSMLPAEILAQNAPTADGTAPASEDAVSSKESTLAPEEDWEVAFPYGTFAFANSEADVLEGGETLIDVLRLGGTTGKAKAYIFYSPSVTPIDEDVYGYGMAAGSEDVVIEVEDPQPAAAYQPYGKLPDPEQTDAKLITKPYEGEDAQEGDLYLTLDVEADEYKWQCMGSFRWTDMDGGTDPGIIITPDQLEQADLRCVFTKDGVQYCTDSYHGEVYEKPEPEELEPMPEDLDLTPEQTFTVVNRCESGEPYRSYIFEMTFADGEDRKQIRVTAPEDEEGEAIKAGTFTIVDCLGGSLYDSANTLAMMVTDNDEADPFTLGFEVKSVRADKSAGVAEVEVRRTGGTQTMVSIDYSTEDGTAVAGEDYEAVSGTLAFYADADLMKIEVPLIDDGVKDDGAVDFKLKLDNLRGDKDGLCTLETTEATVSLYNSATAETENLPTMLHDGSALDASGDVEIVESSVAPVDPAPVSGEQVEVLPEPLTATISGYDGQELDLQTYEYGTIYFNRSDISNYYDQFWDESLYLEGSSPDGGSWTGGQASGDYWKYQNKNSGSATLTIPYFHQKYYHFYGSFNYDIGMEDNTFTAEFVYPYAALTSFTPEGKSVNAAYTTPNKKVSGNFLSGFDVTYDSSGYLSHNWSLDDQNKMQALEIGLKKYDEDNADHEGYCDINYAYLDRRSFNKDLKLRIHTANDGDNPGGVMTAPENCAALEEDSGVYAQMKPEVRLLSGGVGYSGALYVGSTLQVELKNSPSFSPYSGELLSSGIYLTRSDGSIATGPQISKVANSNKYNILMVWNGMTENDLKETYTINVVMTRIQDFNLDLTPSVQRLVDEDGRTLADIDSSKIPQAWDLFWSSPADRTTNWIEVGYSRLSSNAPHFSNYTKSRRFRSDMGGGDMDAVKTLLKQENVQWINFLRKPEDRIIYNGRSYAGNETIWLDTADLAQPKATFRYYNSAYLTATSIMTASVNSVAVYWDGNANGRIDGHYDESIGYFILDEGTEDRLVEYLEEGQKIEESIYSPEVITDKNGQTKLAQYFFRISYTMTPRSLTPDAGQEYGKAQVIPAIVTTVTDPDNYAELTEEQRSYRYIYSGQDAEGNYTSDNHPMYGPEATAIQAVDVPLGGGPDPAKAQADGSFTWEPYYEGNLMFPSESPEPVFIPHSLAGDNLPITDEYSYSEEGDVEMTEEGAAMINAYLGSFVGNSKITLCVQEQESTISELELQAEEPGEPRWDWRSKKIKPESTTAVENNKYEDSDHVQTVEEGVDTDGKTAGVDMDDSDSDFPAFNLDLRTAMPKFNVGGTDHSFVQIAVSDYEIEVGFSLPIYSRNLLEGEGQWLKDGVSDNFKCFQQMANFLGKKGGERMKHLKDESYSKAQSGETVSKDFAISFTFSFVVAWKYNPVINDFFFERFAFVGQAALDFKITKRFDPCPLLYVYLKVSISVSLSTGGSFTQIVEKEEIPVIGEKQPSESLKSLTLKKGYRYIFSTPYKTFNITFDGKIGIELFEDEDCTKPVKGSIRGFLTSDGGDPITANLKRSDSMKLDGSGKDYYVKIKALEDTTITDLTRVTGVHRRSYWSGFTLAPEAFVEVGAGIGCEIAKFELFAKVSIGCAMTFGAYNEEEDDYDLFCFDEFGFDLALGFRAVFLFLSYEMDLIGYHVGYEDGEGWSHSWSALGDTFGGEIGTLGELDEVDDGVTVSAPADTSQTQNIYSNGEDELGLLAYDANDPAVPFQLSGFSTSGDAFKLADGLSVGYNYRVLSVGEDNYVVYTISRSGAQNAMDNTMIVLSRLRLTGTTYGLVNPVDENDPTPYIPVDTVTNTTTIPAQPGQYGQPGTPSQTVVTHDDDGTGDLDFDVWAEGTEICAAWVSYDAPTPAGEKRDAAAAGTHTLIKRASFDTENGEAFTDAAVLSDTGANVALPGGGRDATVFVRTVPMSSAERQQAEAGYKAYLKSIGNDPDDAVNASGTVGRYRLLTQGAVWDVAGKSSRLCVTLNSGERAEMQLADGQTIENVEYTEINGKYYVAYTTTELRYTDEAGQEAADPANAKNLLAIKRLFLRTFTVENGRVVWTNHGGAGDESKGVLLRTLYDYDNNESLQDGVYRNGAVEPYENPFISNLQFLRGKLGESLSGEEEDFTLLADRVEDFLLFEMNGSTYLIREDSLVSIASQQKGSIITFFAPGVNQSGKQDTNTGRDAVTIGADSAGNLAAVYVSAVDHTTNNALYLTKYDPTTGSWGAGTILAMNHMDVYEDNIAENRSGEDSERAYFGKLEGAKGGGMDQFTFENLQFALGANMEEHDSLLILTQGNMLYLTETQAEMDGEMKDLIIPLPNSETSGIERSKKNPAGIGVYAISYGVGQQCLGEGSIHTENYDFTAGSEMYAIVRFTNVGDIGIRGSDKDNQEITVNLDAQTPIGGIPLASWKITENILPGQQTELDANIRVEQTLPIGSKLTLTVKEGDYYAAGGGVPYQASLDLYEITGMPELGFESFSISPVGVDENGDTILSVDMLVGNRGTSAADDVKLQFSYDLGEQDEAGQPIYAALNITGHDLHVGEQEMLPLAADDMENGFLSLMNIDPGYGRRVRGTITVSPEYYLGVSTGSLNLRAEIFSDADTLQILSDTGLHEVEHGEYNGSDNRSAVSIEHQTFFAAASKVTIPLGNTLRLPVSLSTTTGEEAPRILVTEFPDQDLAYNLGILRFNGKGYADGHEEGTLVVAPSQTGSGFIRVLDVNTNSFYDIAYTVTDPAEGINIFIDNGMFTFRNEDGSTYDPKAAASAQDWAFDDTVRTWGADGTEPYLNNLSRGKVGSSFSFDTQSERLDLILNGTVRVESTLPGFEPVTMTAGGGDGADAGEYASVQFGTNSNNTTHTVTITVLKAPGMGQYADFDRLIEHFGSAGTPTPADDKRSPHIYWSRSFPDTASILNGESVQLSAYIIDDGTLSNTFVDGKEPEGLIRHTDSFWEIPMTIDQNGTFSIEATDASGNRTNRQINIEWFNKVVTIGSVGDAPDLRQTDLRFVQEDGTPVPPEEKLNAAPWLNSGYELGQNETSSAYIFYNSEISDSPLAKEEGERWLAISNGVYMVRVDRADGSWARAFIALTNLDLSEPLLSVTPGDRTIEITASDNETLAELSINGYVIPVEGSLYSGSFKAPFSGSYTVAAVDNAGNRVEQTVQIEAPITLTDGAVEQSFSCAGNVMLGEITLIAAKLTGGAYEETVSTPDQNQYRAIYSAALVDGGKEPSDTDFQSLEAGKYTFKNLAEGSYDLYLRDSKGTRTKWEKPVTVAHPEGQWNEPTYEWSKDSSSVTAKRTCKLDETHFETETVKTTSKVTKQPTCTEKGETTYTAVFKNAAFTEQSRSVADVAALEHTWGEPTYAWSENHATCTATAVCTRDGAHVYSETADAVVDTADATCTTIGTATFTATFKDPMFRKQTEKISGKPLGHHWTNPEYKWSEDRSSVTATAICSRDNSHVLTETVKTNFVLAKPSTFEEKGSGYYLVVFENEVFEPQFEEVVIPEVACEGGEACPSKHFTDMPPITSFSHIPIDWAVLNKVTNGLTATTFGPEDSCTRAQFVTFLWRVKGQPEPETDNNPFTDVKPGAYYYKAVLWAVEQGVTNGTSPTTFSPNTLVTRGQVVTFLWRFEESKEPESDDNPFEDVKSSAFYYKAVLWAVEHKITSGTSPTTFDPNGNCTRAQCVTFLYREFGN